MVLLMPYFKGVLNLENFFQACLHICDVTLFLATE